MNLIVVSGETTWWLYDVGEWGTDPAYPHILTVFDEEGEEIAVFNGYTSAVVEDEDDEYEIIWDDEEEED